MHILRFSALVIYMTFTTSSMHAIAGTGEYNLDWRVDGEVLAYHTCGCADACWIAEVRHTTTNAIQSRLRCDCEKLYFSHPGLSNENIVSESCSSINENADKPDAIRQTIEYLLLQEISN